MKDSKIKTMDFSKFIKEDEFLIKNENKKKLKNYNSPVYLQIELTDRCNLKCSSCPRSYSVSSGSKFELDGFKKILDEMPDLKQASFVGAGETLLVKNFSDFISYCSEKNIFSSCNSNGILVEYRLTNAVKAGLGKIGISIDAIDSNLLAKLRSNVKVDQILRAFESALNITQGTKTIVSAAITLGNENIYDFPNLIGKLSEIGVKDFTVESYHHWGLDKTLNKYSLFHMDKEEAINGIEVGLSIAYEKDLKIKIFNYKRIQNKLKYENAICHWPLDSIYITSKGDVTPCCVNIESNKDNFMGNIFEDTLEKIWNNNRYQSLRNGFVQKNRCWKMCEDCVYRMEFGLI